MPTNRTEAQKNASKQNGAKSRGPTTPEGRARCAQAARKHGRYAASLVLPNESESRYRAILDGLNRAFQPANFFESALVAKMAAAHWRYIRSLGQHSALTELEMFLQKDEVAGLFSEIDAAGVQALAFKSLAVHDPGVLYALHQEENSHARQFDRAARLLLQSRRWNPKNAKGPEPVVTPDQTHQPLTAKEPPLSQDPFTEGSRETPDLHILETTTKEVPHDHYRYRFTNCEKPDPAAGRTRLQAVVRNIPPEPPHA
jgi:hypothetical protein